ncbi:GNAT family N-acetyltransferase [Sulfitobacter aestuarii]|uniref:GNAT family N-acetyltransferase n=1 Tax=Sulfitobacter aestuarii TaxID=2161676 RepID=A0ABW5TYR8_9RHOB
MRDTPTECHKPLLQSPAFAAALRACGQDPVILPGGLLVLRRRFLGLRLAMLPRAVPPPDLLAQLREAGLQNLPLILSPETPCPLPPAWKLRTPQMLAKVDLRPPPVRRRAALHGKWRNQLRRAEGAELGVSHAPLPADPHHPLLLADAAQARQRGYRNWPARLTAAFAAAAPDQTRLFTAHHRGRPVAHMLFLRHGNAATYHIGNICSAGKALQAHNLLLWQASLWLAEQGHDLLDLGPVCAAAPGLARFKTRAGASLVPTGGTWLRWQPLRDRRATCAAPGHALY